MEVRDIDTAVIKDDVALEEWLIGGNKSQLRKKIHEPNKMFILM